MYIDYFSPPLYSLCEFEVNLCSSQKTKYRGHVSGSVLEHFCGIAKYVRVGNQRHSGMLVSWIVLDLAECLGEVDGNLRLERFPNLDVSTKYCCNDSSDEFLSLHMTNSCTFTLIHSNVADGWMIDIQSLQVCFNTIGRLQYTDSTRN